MREAQNAMTIMDPRAQLGIRAKYHVLSTPTIVVPSKLPGSPNNFVYRYFLMNDAPLPICHHNNYVIIM